MLTKTPKPDRSSASRIAEVPPEKVFTPYVASIEKKNLRLKIFMATYGEDTTVFDRCKLNTLNTYIEKLRNQVLRMEATWDTMRDDGSLSLAAITDIGTLVEQTQLSAEETLDKAETFRIDRAKIAVEAEDVKEEEMADSPSPDDLPSRTDKLDGRLDNTLRPENNLSRTMSLEEATKWIEQFESYLDWNKPLIGKKSDTAVRNLLESSLEAGLVSKLRTGQKQRSKD